MLATGYHPGPMPASLLAVQSPGWRRELRGWIDDRLADAGLRRRGPLRLVHDRPWSTVFRLATERGALYCKVTAPSLTNDAAVTAWLSVRFPELVLRPLAVDAKRRWMLLPHGGRRLRSAGRHGLRSWEELLPRYAEMQRTLVGSEADLLALGVMDRRPARLAAQVGGSLDAFPAQRTAVHRRLAEIERAAAEAEGTGIGTSLQHDDLHAANVFAGPEGTRIFDWGDAAVSHPFATLPLTLASAARMAGLEPSAPSILRLRDAYLEPWTAERPLAELLAALAAVERVYPIMRALSWQAAFASVPADAEHELRGAAAEWLNEYLRAGD